MIPQDVEGEKNRPDGEGGRRAAGGWDVQENSSPIRSAVST